MAVSDTDLLLVQRGTVPYKTTADALASYSNTKIELGDGKDIPIASAVQLGVIKVGTNLDIEADGTLNAVIPAGVEYMGPWGTLDTPPTATTSGQFWIWNGGDGTLNNALWGAANGSAVSDNDRLLYDGTSFDILPAGAGGGLTEITGTAPIVVSAVNDGEQDVSLPASAADQDGYMSKEDKAKLDAIEAGAGVNVDPSQVYAAAATNGSLTLSPGGDVTTIPAATSTEAGLMTNAQFNKLDAIEDGAEANVNPTQTYTAAADGGTLTLTPGGDATVIPVVDGVNAGLMTPADKTNLDNLTASPGGVLSLVAGDGININTAAAPGTAGTPEVNVNIYSPEGAVDNTTSVLPSNLLLLGDLP